jgi:hypothetical protein
LASIHNTHGHALLVILNQNQGESGQAATEKLLEVAEKYRGQGGATKLQLLVLARLEYHHKLPFGQHSQYPWSCLA